MTIYDRDGMPVDMAALTVDELNGLMRESVDMLRRRINPDKRCGDGIKSTLDALEYSAVRFTNEWYGKRISSTGH